MIDNRRKKKNDYRSAARVRSSRILFCAVYSASTALAGKLCSS